MFPDLPLSSQNTALVTLGIGLVGGLLVWWLTGRLRQRLIARNVLDHPNARSSHTVPTPRGGGLAVIAIGLPLGMAVATIAGAPVLAVGILFAAAAVLALVSLIDDVRTVGPGPRFAIQVLAVAGGLWALLPLVPPYLSGALLAGAIVIAVIGWLWFVNLYNFMDGTDGIAVVETVSICLGIASIDLASAWLPGDAASGVARQPWLWAPALVLAAATMGFAAWNWAPAKIFLGDVGSVPLGYLLGGLLLILVLQGAVLPALILPAYYLADASLTIGRRLLRGEKPWQPHKEHFYQKAVQQGLSHAAVASRVALCNLILVGCSLAALAGWPVIGMAGAAVCVAVLLASFARVSFAGSNR